MYHRLRATQRSTAIKVNASAGATPTFAFGTRRFLARLTERGRPQRSRRSTEPMPLLAQSGNGQSGGTFGGFGLLPMITDQGSAYRRRWLRDQLRSRLQNGEHRYGAQWLALSARLGELSEQGVECSYARTQRTLAHNGRQLSLSGGIRQERDDLPLVATK